jgi:hypothetical protein
MGESCAALCKTPQTINLSSFSFALISGFVGGRAAEEETGFYISFP